MLRRAPERAPDPDWHAGGGLCYTLLPRRSVAARGSQDQASARLLVGRAAGFVGVDAEGWCGMKVRSSVKRICAECKIIRRHGKVRVVCKADPKHKQVQG